MSPIPKTSQRKLQAKMKSCHIFKEEITPILHNANFICKSVVPGKRISNIMKQVGQALFGAGLFLRAPEVLPQRPLPPVGSEGGESRGRAYVWKPGPGSEMWGTFSNRQAGCGEDPSPGLGFPALQPPVF